MKRSFAVALTAGLLCTVLMVLTTIETATAETRQRALPTKRIDISFHNADIHNVLRLFAELGNVNIVYGEDVGGTVTMQLKRVRWDHALSAILRTKGLDMAVEDNIIRVAKAEAFVQERERQIGAREHCLKTSPLQTRIIRVSHGRASNIVPHIEATLSERGSVTVDERTNALIVRDVTCPR